jgi:hypothetical protein
VVRLVEYAEIWFILKYYEKKTLFHDWKIAQANMVNVKSWSKDDGQEALRQRAKRTAAQ